MLEAYLVQSCTLVTVNANEWGDLRPTSTKTLSCRWRDIPKVMRSEFLQQNDADSMVWFAPNAPVTKGSILVFEGLYYEVMRLNRARRLGESSVQFLKCDVKIKNIGVS